MLTLTGASLTLSWNLRSSIYDMDTCAPYMLFKGVRVVFDIIYMAKLSQRRQPSP